MDRSSCLLRNRPIRARNKHNRRLRCAIRVRKGPHGVREYSNRWNTVRISSPSSKVGCDALDF
ncbi:hypothetical protein RHGRI_000579 [Rhododendron griersonianum]|uniref:Ribosomal protein S12 n=1 Tax=Rhododendron griersonianum TaxID=479676 RepID=A0AAV6LI54_9ERIC|nr:hypothetical protein RHGRI_015239 [Rhododendron griersonianum]KAG5564436.1 hypothetical protein RHGRI_000579 [Rhododendron griersonianum]